MAKYCFALLADDDLHNYARKLSVKLCENINYDFLGAVLPPHISLKQPFKAETLESVETYFDNLCGKMKPLRLLLGPSFVWNTAAGLDVKETGELRDLHNRLNSELKSVCNDSSADFDGADYRFHLTLAQWDDLAYTEKARELLKDEQNTFPSYFRKLVMFYYDGKAFTTYKINELKGH